MLRPPRARPTGGQGAIVDWAGWAVFGLVATTGLTAVMIAAQLAGRTRLDLPLVLGTITTEDPDRARVVRFALKWVLVVERRRMAGCAVGEHARMDIGTRRGEPVSG